MNYDSWNIPNIAASAANVPQGLLRAGYPPLLAAVLAARGFSSPEDANDFLFAGADNLHDPMLMADMDKAVARIRLAAERSEHVAVYGDYDVDGITSSCLIVDCIRSLGLSCELYIPDRIEEGYGLNCAAIDYLHSLGVDLIVTVDCGVTGIAETLHARELGIDMVITDHHECRPTLPDACAVVDPKRPDCRYPEDSLAGVGVAFKLACALTQNVSHTLEKYADLLAIGTIADVMPMLGENRFIIKYGLEKLMKQPRPGLAALIGEAGIAGKSISAMTVGFSIAPRLNAAGRLGRSNVAAELLLSDDPERCSALAKELCRMNQDRQTIELDIWQEALSMLEGEAPSAPIVLAGDNWHQGVIGIAASRLTEAYSLPAVMICLDGDKGKGSCRSFGGFNLFEALKACETELESFGGHALAAGLSIHRDKIDSFRRALALYYQSHKPERGPELFIDVCIVDSRLLEMDNVLSLEKLEPCGTGNPRAIMCLTGAALQSITPIGGGKHVKLRVAKFGKEYDCVFFSHSASSLGVSAGDKIDLAFHPQINEFRGRRAVQLLVTAVRPSDESGLCRRVLGEEAVCEREATEIMPDRMDFVRLWKRISAIGGSLSAALPEALNILNTGGSAAADCLCLTVFAEMGLLSLGYDGNILSVSVRNGAKKADLESSEKLRRLREFAARSDLSERKGR